MAPDVVGRKKPGGANQSGFSRLAALRREGRPALVAKHGLVDHVPHPKESGPGRRSEAASNAKPFSKARLKFLPSGYRFASPSAIQARSAISESRKSSSRQNSSGSSSKARSAARMTAAFIRKPFGVTAGVLAKDRSFPSNLFSSAHHAS